MSLNVGDALETAVSRTTTRAGLTLACAFFVLQLLVTLFTTNMNAAIQSVAPPGEIAPIVLPVGALASGVLSLVAYVLFAYIGIVAIRSMVSDVTDHVPGEFFTQNVGPALVWWFVASIVVGILVTIGFVLLVVPGIYLALGLAFTLVYVAVEDETAFTAMQSSWDLASGNRWRLLATFLVPGVVYILVAGILGVILPSTTVAGWVLTGLVGAVWAVFIQALLGACYRQLRDAADDAGTESDVGPADGGDDAPHATVADA
ncbi:putative membrane protein [Halarchaeum solikamskense]|uniref:glycerophosphoryl diester phosphodiesterase membrane domain-containing protein n=1 Tax=Halarchaeum nitratireducens TaxID=489913 RepID=UPI001B3AD001|nr:glycerophosphoryl diester phosphodiesterase membrane domain-containing protein [Halarchaeum solikamskense]MBP2250382.1 putative membrane protein [Halarchaeum solikamskense]